jgi:hypothetical protein
MGSRLANQEDLGDFICNEVSEASGGVADVLGCPGIKFPARPIDDNRFSKGQHI